MAASTTGSGGTYPIMLLSILFIIGMILLMPSLSGTRNAFCTKA